MTRASDIFKALTAELAAHGITEYRVERGGSHHKLFFKAPRWTKERFYVFSGTPSDDRGLKNSVSDLRKMIGPKPKAKKSAKPKRARNKTEPKATPKPIAKAPDDWRAVLGRVRVEVSRPCDPPAMQPGEVRYVDLSPARIGPFMRAILWLDRQRKRLIGRAA